MPQHEFLMESEAMQACQPPSARAILPSFRVLAQASPRGLRHSKIWVCTPPRARVCTERGLTPRFVVVRATRCRPAPSWTMKTWPAAGALPRAPDGGNKGGGCGGTWSI